MKSGLFLLLIVFAQSAFALYGKNVTTSNDGFVVSLILNDSQNPDTKFFCNGVLISPTKVLTAGHCIDGLGVEVYDESQTLVYRPELMNVKAGKEIIRAKSVMIAPSYYEGIGHDTQDLAIIELTRPVANVTPVKFLPKPFIQKNLAVTLIARGKKVDGTVISVRQYQKTAVMFLNGASGACRGDSGGAIVVQQNGEPKLAGILMYSGDGVCDQKTGYGHLPRGQF